MEQLLLHLWGDYVTQSDWMAQNKTKAWFPATVHAAVYSLPFLLLTGLDPRGVLAWHAIFWTHLLIDRFRLARYVVWAKEWIADRPPAPWARCCATGYSLEKPAWLAVWLMIAADNTLHLTINYLALRFL